MKLTTVQLRRLIKEELHRVISEKTFDENPLGGGASQETIQKAIGGKQSPLLKYQTNYDDDYAEAKQIKAIADALQKGASFALKGEENRDAQIYASELAQSLTTLADENDKQKLARARQQILKIKADSGLMKNDRVPMEHSRIKEIMDNLKKATGAPKNVQQIEKMSKIYPLVAKWYALANDETRKELEIEEERAAQYVLGAYLDDKEWQQELRTIAKNGNFAELEKFFTNKGDGAADIEKYFG